MSAQRGLPMECRLVGALPLGDELELRQRLAAASGAQPPQHVRTHEVLLKPAPGVEGTMDRSASVRLVRQLHLEQQEEERRKGQASPGTPPGVPQHCCRSWLVRSEGLPLRHKAVADLPVLVRPVLVAACAGPDVPGSWAALGMAPEYELLKDGWSYVLAHDGQQLQVGVYRVSRLAQRGDLSSAATIGPGGHLLVEATVLVDQGEQAIAGARALISLRSVLAPLVELRRPTK